MKQPLVTRPAYQQSPTGDPVGFIYLVVNQVNGKFYVGRTEVSLRRRWSQHCCSARKGNGHALHAAIRKYGEANFQILYLEAIYGTPFDLDSAERFHIRARNTMSPYGYNLTEGGEGPDFSVESTRKKHSEAMRALAENPEWRRRLMDGIAQRQKDPTYRKNQLAGVRKSAAKRRSSVCTKCGTSTANNTPRRSWCRDCHREYHREYSKRRRQKAKEATCPA